MFDQARLTGQAKMRKRLLEREFTYPAVGPVRLPIVGDITVLPVLPERLNVDAVRTDIIKNAFECAILTLANADQRAKHVE